MMKKILLLFIAVPLLFPVAGKAQTIVNKFDIQASVNGSTLSLWLDTDLPDEVIVLVDVERYYWEVGNDSAYTLEYFSDKAPVSDWRQSRNIEINNEAWKAAFEQKKVELQKMMLDMNVEKISPMVKASMRVYPSQQQEGLYQDLKGAALEIDEHGRISIEQEIEFDYPLDFKPIALPSLDPNKLDIGQTYIVSKKTPIMPHHSPAADAVFDVLKEAKAVMPGGALTIIGKHDKNSTPWYEITVVDAHTKETTKGWVNSVALYGQELRVK